MAYEDIFDFPPLKEAERMLFTMSSYDSLAEAEQWAYDADLKAYRDMIGQLVCAKEDGREEGREEGRKEGRKEGLAEGLAKGRAEGRTEGRAEGQAIIVRSMVQGGLDLNQIAKLIHMSIADVERILNSN